MADLNKKRKNITPKKETLGRKKHNSEDRAEVIIVSDDETEVNISIRVKGGYVRKLLQSDDEREEITDITESQQQPYN
jgi:hypothetical protein